MVRRRFPLILVVFVLLLGWAGVALAHPMGNFSVSHYSGITVGGAGLRIDYRIDYAEIPSMTEMRAVDTDGDRQVTAAEEAAFLAKRAPELTAKLKLDVDGKVVPLTPEDSTFTRREGAAGLPTLLVGVRYTVNLPPGRHRVVFVDENYPDRTGWREMVVEVAEGGTVIECNVPRTSRSKGLSEYPAELTTAPPDEREARLLIETTGAAAPTTAPVASIGGSGGAAPTPKDAFTQLISARDLSPVFVVTALGIAFALGTVHGLSPGHGKTVVAAYLVGSHGTARHAVLLGVVVTLTHVAAVFALGVAVKVLQDRLAAEDVQTWLGFLSGLLIVALAVWQFTRRWALARQRRRMATPGEFVAFSPMDSADHVHGPGGHTHDMPERITLPALVTLGISGGIVPCPSALVVLLSAVAFGRVGFGIILIVAFSVGLAAVLIAIGLLMLYARRFVDRWDGAGAIIGRLSLASPVVIGILGAGIAVTALRAGRVW